MKWTNPIWILILRIVLNYFNTTHFSMAWIHFLKEGVDDGHLKQAKPELYVALYIKV